MTCFVFLGLDWGVWLRARFLLGRSNLLSKKGGLCPTAFTTIGVRFLSKALSCLKLIVSIAGGAFYAPAHAKPCALHGLQFSSALQSPPPAARGDGERLILLLSIVEIAEGLRAFGQILESARSFIRSRHLAVPLLDSIICLVNAINVVSRLSMSSKQARKLYTAVAVVRCGPYGAYILVRKLVLTLHD